MREAAMRLSRGIPQGPLETEEPVSTDQADRAALRSHTHVTRQHRRQNGPMTKQ